VKKVLLLVSALLIVFSGVAAVSAYEGHLVNIKVHVENALAVETYEWDLGTRFPQERVESDLRFGLSESFQEQSRVSQVDYKLCWELKPAPTDNETGNITICNPYMNMYYQPLNPYLTMSVDSDGDSITGNTTDVPAPGEAVCWGQGTLFSIPGSPGQGDLCDFVHLSYSVPVFEGYYNEITDVPPPGWVYGMIDADNYCLVEETVCNFTTLVPHADLGIDLKIQVTSIVDHG
jgi:hypothetical protein